MSDARQKFEAINPKSPTHQMDTKAVRVDQVVDTKNNLQEAAEALKDGKMPTTNQITEVIDTVRDAKLREGVELSSTGQRVTEKLDQVLDSTKRLVNDKNKNNEIQKLIHHSKLASLNLESDIDMSDSQKALQKSYSNLVVLAQMVVTSSEFRGLLGDFYNLFRDILQDNNVPGANKLPSAKEMTTKDGKIDQNKVKQVTNEMSQDVKKASKDMAEEKKDQVYSQMDGENRRKLEKVENGQSNDLANDMMNMAIQSAGQAVKPMVDQASKGNTEQAKREGQEIAKDTKSAAEGYANEASGQAAGIKNQIQNQAKEKMNQASDAISNISLNDEQLEMLADRFSGIVEEAQSRPEYQKALQGLFEVVHDIKRNAETAANNVTSHAKEDSDLTEAVSNAKRAVENFAGHYSLDSMINLLKDLANKAETDEKLKKILHSNYQFILDAFKDKKFIHDDKFNEKAIERFNSSREYLLKVYGEPIKKILSEGSNFVKGLREDPTTNRAISDLESLTKELFMDESGRPTIKYDLLQDFHKFVPVLAKRLNKLEMPRIAGDDDGLEYILDNISLACDNILPRTVRVRTDTEFDNEEDVIKNVISVKMSGVQASAKDIAFYFKKKILLSTVEDSGIVNVVIDKEGLDIFLKLAPRPIENNPSGTIYAQDQPNFIVLESKCRVNDISVNFQHAKYDLLYKMFNKSIQSTIKRQIENAVGENIRAFMEGIDTAITSQNQSNQVDKPSKPLDPSPDGWKSDAFSSDAK